jgi:hypothetical protein
MMPVAIDCASFGDKLLWRDHPAFAPLVHESSLHQNLRGFA